MNKQIEEMANALRNNLVEYKTENNETFIDYDFSARELIAEGYRKSTDVAREIFAELELKAPFFCENQVAYEHFKEELAKLKKKYESEGEE